MIFRAAALALTLPFMAPAMAQDPCDTPTTTARIMIERGNLGPFPVFAGFAQLDFDIAAKKACITTFPNTGLGFTMTPAKKTCVSYATSSKDKPFDVNVIPLDKFPATFKTIDKDFLGQMEGAVRSMCLKGSASKPADDAFKL